MCSYRFLQAFALALTLAGCGDSGSLPVPERAIDPALLPVLNEFLKDAKQHGREIGAHELENLRVIKFVDDVNTELATYDLSESDANLATCATLLVGRERKVLAYEQGVEEATWSEIWIQRDASGSTAAPSSSFRLRDILYHELGHCLLGLDHVEDHPHKIMSPKSLASERFLLRHWDELVSELFQAATEPASGG